MEVANFLDRVTKDERTTLKVLEKVDGMPGKLFSVEQRSLQPEAPAAPLRVESPKRMHIFYQVDGFRDYLLKYGSDKNVVVFADPQAGGMVAVLDESAKTGFELIRFTPQVHPLFVPWLKFIGMRVKLESFVQHLLQNRRCVQDGPELAIAFSQVKASTSVELQRGRGKSSLNGLLVATTIQGVAKNEIVELPDELRITLPLYVGTKPREFILDLTLETVNDGKEVTAALSSVDLDEARVQAFEDFFAALGALKEKGATLTMGAPLHEEWEYLENSLVK